MNHGFFRIIGVLCAGVVGVSAQAAVIYVDSDAEGKGDGTSWPDAFASLSAAIEKAVPGDEIWVSEGSYGPIALKSGVRLYGGFVGTESSVATADPRTHKTFISGSDSAQAVRGIGLDSSTVLRGFHVVQGRAVGWGEVGGGLYLENSSPVIVACVFEGNRADWAGGAVASYKEGAPTFVNCRFSANGTIVDEKRTIAGGAVFIRDGKVVFANCLFDGNKASEGGAVVNIAGEVRFVNCTFTENEALDQKGGALFDDSGLAVADNCIFWDNRAKTTGTTEIHNNTTVGTTGVSHSIVKGGWAGTGNASADPLFVDPAKGDYRLQAASPCRDKGLAAALPHDTADLTFDGNTTERLSKDLNLKARVYGDAVDMGAFEWHP